jgi:hypothetical protein
VVTAGQSGVAWGYRLLLLQLALIPVLYLVHELTVRLGIFTGRGHGELIRETETIPCLESGWEGQMLHRHAGHDPTEYRSRWSLRPDYPMTAPGYSGQRSELARQIGLGRSGARQRKRIEEAKVLGAAEEASVPPATRPSHRPHRPRKGSTG